MEGYNRSSHAVYRCEYHFVWVPKYRYHVLVKEVKPRLKEILIELRKRYWGMHIWARGYFVSTVGIDSDIIKQYVRQQQEDEVRTEQLHLWRDNDG